MCLKHPYMWRPTIYSNCNWNCELEAQASFTGDCDEKGTAQVHYPISKKGG